MLRYRGKAPWRRIPWLMVLAAGAILAFGCSSSSEPDPPPDPEGLELTLASPDVILGATVTTAEGRFHLDQAGYLRRLSGTPAPE